LNTAAASFGTVFENQEADMMTKCKTMAQEMKDILIRLRELDQLDFPQYRSYKREDGIWVDRELVPEYLEQKELIRRWEELRLIEQYFHTAHNHLMVSLRLWCIANDLQDEPEPMDVSLLSRIAISVYQNTSIA
jgi:hypothetical protein